MATPIKKRLIEDVIVLCEKVTEECREHLCFSDKGGGRGGWDEFTVEDTTKLRQLSKTLSASLLRMRTETFSDHYSSDQGDQ